MTITRNTSITALAFAALLVSACSKKTAVVAPPSAPAAQSAAAAPAPARPSDPPERAAVVETPAPKTAPRFPDDATRQKLQDLLSRFQDAYFDYSKHAVRPDAEKALLANSQAITEILRQYPEYKLTIEGHCDERGSSEYNIALGDARAKAAREYLIALGIPSDQLATVSYGEERPVCSAQTEECWQQNRRAHVVALPR